MSVLSEIDKKTIQNVKKFLNTRYVDILQYSTLDIKSVDYGNIPTKNNTNHTEQKIIKLAYYKNIVENIKNIVDHANNDEIKAILKNLTSPSPLSDWSISTRLNLSHSTYYRRKQQAYLLLGKMLAMVTDINLIA